MSAPVPHRDAPERSGAGLGRLTEGASCAVTGEVAAGSSEDGSDSFDHADDTCGEESGSAVAHAPESAVDDILCGLMAQTPRVPEHSRHYRCANFGLYLGCALLVLIAVSYYLTTRPVVDQPVQSITALFAGLAAIVWALHYCSISYCIDSNGIRSRRLFGRKRSISWSQLSHWEVIRIIEPEQATCRIIFSSSDGAPPITLSSELLELEAVENLARELQGSKPL